MQEVKWGFPQLPLLYPGGQVTWLRGRVRGHCWRECSWPAQGASREMFKNECRKLLIAKTIKKPKWQIQRDSRTAAHELLYQTTHTLASQETKAWGNGSHEHMSNAADRKIFPTLVWIGQRHPSSTAVRRGVRFLSICLSSTTKDLPEKQEMLTQSCFVQLLQALHSKWTYSLLWSYIFVTCFHRCLLSLIHSTTFDTDTLLSVWWVPTADSQACPRGVISGAGCKEDLTFRAASPALLP